MSIQRFRKGRGTNSLTKLCQECKEESPNGYWLYFPKDEVIGCGVMPAIFICDECLNKAKSGK